MTLPLIFEIRRDRYNGLTVTNFVFQLEWQATYQTASTLREEAVYNVTVNF